MRSHNKEKELKETDMAIKYDMNGTLGQKKNNPKKISKKTLKVHHQEIQYSTILYVSH